jgi:hypothetical protein
MEAKQSTETKAIHKFEADGLGKAPFHVVGNWLMPSRSLLEHNPEAWNNAIRTAPCRVGSCAYCGTALSIHYIIKSADDKKFAVGCECVNKTGDKGLINAVKVAKNARERLKREEKRNAEREARLQAERDANGGLTNYELQQQQAEAKRQAEIDRLQPFIEILEPFGQRLIDHRGGFCDSVGEDLCQGRLPEGNALKITVDILAKQIGRRGSKNYNAEAERINNIFASLEG